MHPSNVEAIKPLKIGLVSPLYEAVPPKLYGGTERVVAYLAVSLQGSLQALMPVNRLVHFTDWVIGHSHFAMIGFASFAAVGGLLHVWKQTAGLRYNAGAIELLDAGSSNGTFLGKERLTPHQPRRLDGAAVVAVADVLELELEPVFSGGAGFLRPVWQARR